MRQYDAIDLAKLYSMGSNNGWNKILTECLEKRDINRLTKLRYQIQAGMDDLTKQKLNSDQMSSWFLRLQKSIELTINKIIKLKNPMPLDNPLIKNKESLDIKRKRDLDLELHLKKSSY